MIAKYLSTIDNPFDPFDQPDDWRNFDEGKGYYTTNYVARIALTSPDMSEEHEQEEWNRAVDECQKFNILGIYTTVEREVS